MSNNRSSVVFLGWTLVVALMLTSAFAIYKVSAGMLSHLHQEVALNNFAGITR